MTVRLWGQPRQGLARKLHSLKNGFSSLLGGTEAWAFASERGHLPRVQRHFGPTHHLLPHSVQALLCSPLFIWLFKGINILRGTVWLCG